MQGHEMTMRFNIAAIGVIGVYENNPLKRSSQ